MLLYKLALLLNISLTVYSEKVDMNKFLCRLHKQKKDNMSLKHVWIQVYTCMVNIRIENLFLQKLYLVITNRLFSIYIVNILCMYPFHQHTCGAVA